MILTRWQHALLSLFITLCLLAGLWAAVVMPLQAYYNSRVETLDETRSRLVKFQRMAVQNGSLKAKLDQAKAAQPAQNYFMQAQSVSLAAAQLQDKVKSLITSHKGELISTQVVPSKSTVHFTPVSIRVSIRIDIVGLQSVLYQLESARPLAYLDAMRIQYRGMERRHEDDKKSHPIPLNVQFTLTAYMLKQHTQNG